MGNRVVRLTFAVCVVVQLAMLYWPRAVSPVDGFGLDKVTHAALFFAVVWTGALSALQLWPLVVVSLVHAPVSELVQHVVLPGRSGDPMDAVADVTGVIAAVVLVMVMRTRRLADPADGGREGWR